MLVETNPKKILIKEKPGALIDEQTQLESGVERRNSSSSALGVFDDRYFLGYRKNGLGHGISYQNLRKI